MSFSPDLKMFELGEINLFSQLEIWFFISNENALYLFVRSRGNSKYSRDTIIDRVIKRLL